MANLIPILLSCAITGTVVITGIATLAAGIFLKTIPTPNLSPEPTESQ